MIIFPEPAAEGAAVAAPVASVAPDAPHAAPRPGVIAWVTSERDAREQARRRGVPLLVYVRADWAAACLSLERSAWTDPRVAGEVRRFVALRLDVTEAEGDAELYAQRYGVKGVPETLVLDLAGRTAARGSGAMSAEALFTFLQGAAAD